MRILTPRKLKDNAATSSSSVTAPVNCEGFSNVQVQVAIADVADPAGVITVEGSIDVAAIKSDQDLSLYGGVSETARWVPLTLLLVHVAGGATFTTPDTDIDVAVTTTAADILALFKDPPVRIRVRWVRASGGGATGLTIISTGREF